MVGREDRVLDSVIEDVKGYKMLFKFWRRNRVRKIQVQFLGMDGEMNKLLNVYFIFVFVLV